MAKTMLLEEQRGKLRRPKREGLVYKSVGT
jgi:hypothetical protein